MNEYSRICMFVKRFKISCYIKSRRRKKFSCLRQFLSPMILHGCAFDGICPDDMTEAVQKRDAFDFPFFLEERLYHLGLFKNETFVHCQFLPGI